MPRPASWRYRITPILGALRALDTPYLERAQIESIFGLQRRAAIRLMAPFVSGRRRGSWQVDRQRLILWLESFEREVTEDQERSQRVLQALQSAEQENRSLREELRNRGRPDPPSWTLKQEVFSRNILSLPHEITITQGMVCVSFPVADPIRGAQLLHELSLAMVNDWGTFCRLAGSVPNETAEDVVNRFLNDLEDQKQGRR
jgi:hypothetical protein